MQNLVKEYERSAQLLHERIQQLNGILKREDELGNQERDMLLLRRNLLTDERTELLRDIRLMQSHWQSEGC